MRRLPLILILPLAALIAVAGADDSPTAGKPDVQQRYESARERTDAARTVVLETRIRLAELMFEQRLLRSTPAPADVPNPLWERLSSELQAAERNALRLGEELAPAHPKMLAAEAEVLALRGKLASTNKLIVSHLPTEQSPALAELDLARRIYVTEQDLRRAQKDLERAEQEAQRATFALFSVQPPPAPAAVVPPASNFSLPDIWLPAFCVAALVLLWRLTSTRRAERHTARSSLGSDLRIDEPVRRIVYPAASSRRKPAAPAARPPAIAPLAPAEHIIPRRRSA